uniref:Large ribosomal subunit protein uL2m n=1 Tax=Callipsygma wilsonis TaxID=2320807 RepID=A0A386AZY2_9CHLO|nr:ribosomal protein L2 [Callipsygma wilsonis]AYC65007.1 ribosomal protein L2 [Callipsygma wilsonis]
MKKYIDFKTIQINVLGKIKKISYEPNRSGYISEVLYQNGLKKYHLHTYGLKIGSYIIASPTAPLTKGNTLPLKNIPLGTNVYNIEPIPGKGSKFARAAGTSALLVSKSKLWVTLRLPSGEIRLFSENCWATIGQVSNIKKKKKIKAGNSRWLGIRPKVRGSAKNPVDHPHGGGEGKAPIGKSHPVNPWGKPAIGRCTRRIKKYSDSLIIRRK